MRWVTRAGAHTDRTACAWLLGRIAGIVHEADLEDARYDAPGPAGFDLLLRALSVAYDDDTVLGPTRPLFDAAYEFLRRPPPAGTDSL